MCSKPCNMWGLVLEQWQETPKTAYLAALSSFCGPAAGRAGNARNCLSRCVRLLLRAGASRANDPFTHKPIYIHTDAFTNTHFYTKTLVRRADGRCEDCKTDKSCEDVRWADARYEAVRWEDMIYKGVRCEDLKMYYSSSFWEPCAQTLSAS